jgi:hypothetical protein
MSGKDIKGALEKSKFSQDVITLGGIADGASNHLPRIVLKNATDGKTRVIVAPMPKSLNDTMTLNWDQADAGILGALEGDGLKDAAGSIIDQLKQVDMKAEATRQVIGKTSEAFGKSGTLAQDLLDKKIDKRIINPYREQFFRGIDFRSFTLDWDFVPLSENQSDYIVDAVRALKYGSLPRQQTAETHRYLTYPTTWTIEFYANSTDKYQQEAAKYLPDFGPSFVTSVTIDYMTAGHTGFHANNAPVQQILTVNLTEAKLKYGEEYAD